MHKQVQVGESLAGGEANEFVRDRPGKQAGETVHGPLGFGQVFVDRLQTTAVTVDNLVDADVQAVEGVLVRRQYQQVGGQNAQHARIRCHPLRERIALGFGGKHRDVGRYPRQHLIPGNQQLEGRAVQAGVLGGVA